jgi:flagellar hook-associated protein 2
MATGTITSTTGLATGIDIGGTVDKLMTLAAKPRDMLQANTTAVAAQQTALTKLTALLYAIKVPVNNLAKASVFQERSATSGSPDALAVSVTGNPAVGTYEYTPLQMAQAQKQLSSGLVSDSTPLGVGSMTIRFGNRVDHGASLNVTNGGQGFVRGTMRITDGNGDSANIDLSTAQTVDDVLNAINNSGAINVTATADDGHIHLVDNTGGAGGLKVQDMGSGKTAASLGLAGINASSGVADGQTILALYNGITLSALNDGTGVEANSTLPDIKYTLADGTSGEIDFAPHSGSISQGNAEATLQQLIDEVNQQSAGKLKLAIAADGNSLALTDTTTGTGKLTLQSEYGSLALHDLGLDGGADANGLVTASGNVLSGGRILGGLKTVTLGSLNGGQGLGSLGAITLTDRLGASATVDLKNAQTLDDVIATINASAVAIRAQVNDAGNGIKLVDTSGSQTGSMVVADVAADGTSTATKLNLKTAADSSGTANISSVNSGDLHLKVVGENTLLSSLNGGAGVPAGQFIITDSQKDTATIDLRSDSIKTIGDVIRAINRQGLSAQAELNATGDGILLHDSGGGSGVLTVTESGSTTAAGLGLLHMSSEATNGEQQIDGSMTYKISIYDKDALQNVNAQINQLNANFSSSIISDGSAQPYHLAITSGSAGKAGALVIDTSGMNLTFAETSKAQDSLLLLGPQSSEATAVLTSSSSNTYSNLVDGLKLTIGQATGQTVNVNVTSSSSTLSASVQALADDYNKFRDELTTDTAYDATQNKSSPLTGDGTALSFEQQLSTLLSGQFVGAGKFQSLAAIGITFTQDGQLQYDSTVLKDAVDSDPQAVKDFFTTANTGFAAKLGTLIEQLAGADNSVSTSQIDALQSTIDANNARITEMNARLDTQRNDLLMQFYNMEVAISRLQSSQSALSTIQWMTNGNLFSQSSSSSSSSG